jgi:hypothetical protein
MTFSKKSCDFRYSYCKIVQVQRDVRDRYQYLYRPGEERERYLTVFVKPVKNGLGEVFDRADRAERKARQRRRRDSRSRAEDHAPKPNGDESPER